MAPIPQNVTIWGFMGVNATKTNQTSPIPGTQLLGSPQVRPFPLYWWYLFVPVGIGVAALLYLLAREASRPRVFDFKGALEELERQRSQIGRSSWSGTMRNEVLLRYYSLMQKVCGKMGVRDSPADTPSEYLQRVAHELQIDVGQATKFAEVFNRARYGLELNTDEIADASKFMGGFLDGVRSKVGIG